MSKKLQALLMEAGGQITGKVRFQKIVYLLDQLGFESGFDFEYHHYGPYSEGLSDTLTDEISMGNFRLSEKRRASDGVPYVVYELSGGLAAEVDTSDTKVFSSAIASMQAMSATVLELAATAHWLSVHENREDWDMELRRRKGVKLDGGRDKQALDLLKSLKLRPAA